MKIEEYGFEKDKITLFKSGNMIEIEKDIEEIFRLNHTILPKNKKAKILIKPNFNNDLNALTGNSTDLRILVAVLKSLTKRKYKNIIIGEGCNCGINHIGIDVFKRLKIDKIAKMFKTELVNFNKDVGEYSNLVTGKVEIAKTILDSDFIINLPTIKTHIEAGMTCACKNYMGALKGVQKRKMHDSLHKNIVRLNEIIKTDLIIVDGLICMEGKGPANGIPKKVGIILSGHNPFLVDLLCSKLIGLDYNEIGFLKEALKQKFLSKDDENILKKINKISNFKSAKKNIFSKILLNNFFIGIRFMKPFQKIFDSGFMPWFLFKLGVRQDIYIHEEKDIKKMYEKENLGEKQKEKLKECLKIYCPVKSKSPGDKKCIQCMYCYQICPELVMFKGTLGAFKMQMDRFGKYVKET